MRKLLGFVVAFTTSVALGLLATTPAGANPSIYHEMHTEFPSENGGVVYFYPDGDRVKLCDTYSDGDYVELDIWNVTHDPNTYEYGLIDQYNDGECRTVGAAMGQPYNMAENHCFSFRIRLVDGDTGDIREISTDWARWRNYNNSIKDCPGVD